MISSNIKQTSPKSDCSSFPVSLTVSGFHHTMKCPICNTSLEDTGAKGLVQARIRWKAHWECEKNTTGFGPKLLHMMSGDMICFFVYIYIYIYICMAVSRLFGCMVSVGCKSDVGKVLAKGGWVEDVEGVLRMC